MYKLNVMKKLLIAICFIGITIVSNAQSSGSTNTSTNSSTTESKDKQCHGVTKDCPTPCSNDKASATMSSSHDNAGAVATKSEKKMSKKECKKQMASCEGHSGGSCCEEMSKTKASSDSNSGQSKNSDSSVEATTPK